MQQGDPRDRPADIPRVARPTAASRTDPDGAGGSGGRVDGDARDPRPEDGRRDGEDTRDDARNDPPASGDAGAFHEVRTFDGIRASDEVRSSDEVRASDEVRKSDEVRMSDDARLPDDARLSHEAGALADEMLSHEISVIASPARRLLALTALFGLGAVLAVAAFESDGGLRHLVLLAFSGLAVGGGESLRRATRSALILDRTGLRDSAGAHLAGWDDIETIERGAFATKPSNGFSIVLKAPAPRAWAPGVWWRLGRRIGVGGVLPARETRFMGEQMALILAARTLPTPDDHDET